MYDIQKRLWEISQEIRRGSGSESRLMAEADVLAKCAAAGYQDDIGTFADNFTCTFESLRSFLVSRFKKRVVKVVTSKTSKGNKDE
jgi:hypothetical protein